MYFSPFTFIHLSTDYLIMFFPYTSFFPFLFFQTLKRLSTQLVSLGVD